MVPHPDLESEQAYIDFAYECLEASKQDAWRLRALTEVGRGGTHQARWEADTFEGVISNRLTQLDLRDSALVFGRIDRVVDAADRVASATSDHESFHIGRLAISDKNREPVVVDWRAPVAEPFYRATGRQTMGLARRRHFSVAGPKLIGIEDELFGEGHLGIGQDDGLVLQGYSTLLAALEKGRTGQLGDIVATIQGEQDEIIRSPQAGVLVVQGGPGTGKTVVALHRAAYLLYTHRFPLEDQGVLMIGPNRLFLKYISQVLPSLGEAGVDQVVLSDLVSDAKFSGDDNAQVSKIKGDVRMSKVLSKAVRDRERPLREPLIIPWGTSSLRLTPQVSEQIIQSARRRFRRHNAARRFVEQEVYAALAASSRVVEVTTDEVRARVHLLDDVRLTFERMWPMMTPAQLVHDLFGSTALIKLAASRWLSDDECRALARPRDESLSAVRWTTADAALLDETRALLGPRPDKHGKIRTEDEIRTFGHIVVDEVQDLTPMQLRMCERRSLNGSMTVVGDIAQATGPFAANSWDEMLSHLPDRKDPRIVELTVGYRIPDSSMQLAAKVLATAAPQLKAPISVRAGDFDPWIVSVDDVVAALPQIVNELAASLPNGSLAVVTPDSLAESVALGLEAAGLDVGRAAHQGLTSTVTVVPVSLVKGLELDGVVVVEPARIVREQTQGMRALYVSLTRATQRLCIVHAELLPVELLGG